MKILKWGDIKANRFSPEKLAELERRIDEDIKKLTALLQEEELGVSRATVPSTEIK